MTAAEDVFAQMVDLACRNQRCPFNDALPRGVLSALARDGKIRIEVFRRNWRVVTILVGPHAGKATQRDPSLERGAKPYMVIDRRSNPLAKDAPKGAEPWRPGEPRPSATGTS